MRRLDRLLIQTRAAVNGVALYAALAFIDEAEGRFHVRLMLWDGVPGGKTEELRTDSESIEAAYRAIETLAEDHPTFGNEIPVIYYDYG